MKTNTFNKEKYKNMDLEHVPCPLCVGERDGNDSPLASVGYPGVPVSNVICKTCGLIRINPRMTREGYEMFYREDFFSYLNPYGRPHYVNTIEKTTDPSFQTEAEKKTLPFILPYVKEGGAVLDVGAGFGQILYLLQKAKHIIPHGNEPDPLSRNVAKEKLGIELSADTIEVFLDNNMQLFDYIHLEQVFEHLLEPLDTLRRLAMHLAPEGVIYVGVPGQYNYQVAPDRFFELAHTYGYTPATLRLFAARAGLKIISVRDPLSSNLEVLLAHREASYEEEDEKKLVYGSLWYVTKYRLLGKQAYYTLRRVAREVLGRILGERGVGVVKRLFRV
jgi:SAM-dependent methyltransferase